MAGEKAFSEDSFLYKKMNTLSPGHVTFLESLRYYEVKGQSNEQPPIWIFLFK